MARVDAAGNVYSASLAGRELGGEGSSIVLAQWRADPGRGRPPFYIAPLHVHHEDDEAWYVLSGALGVRLGERELEVPAGGAAIAPRGTPYTYWNAVPEETRYLLVMTPRLRRLIDALHALTERNEQSVAAVFSEHASEYLGWP